MCVCTDVRLPCSQLEDKGGGQVCVNANIILFLLLSGFIDVLILAFLCLCQPLRLLDKVLGPLGGNFPQNQDGKTIINFKVCLNM